MPLIVFIEHNGNAHDAEAEVGQNLMQAAVNHGIGNVLGECGGSCSCATCHAYVDEAWQARLPAATDDERMTLEGVLEPRANSRLLCQIVAEPGHDGLVLHLPARQI